MNETVTLPIAILRAAASLSGCEMKPFSRSQIAVESWRMFPELFGLEGFEDDHPNCTKVWSNLDGLKGLVAKRLIDKVGTKTYRITRTGLKCAEYPSVVCMSVEVIEAMREEVGDTDSSRLVKRLLASTAAKKIERGLRNNLRFEDAWEFWGLNGTDPYATIGEMEKGLRIREENDGQARAMLRMSEYMRGRFDKLLRLMAARKKGTVK